jgi:hypothetical protein
MDAFCANVLSGSRSLFGVAAVVGCWQEFEADSHYFIEAPLDQKKQLI